MGRLEDVIIILQTMALLIEVQFMHSVFFVFLEVLQQMLLRTFSYIFYKGCVLCFLLAFLSSISALYAGHLKRCSFNRYISSRVTAQIILQL